jgi:hypothetical protein
MTTRTELEFHDSKILSVAQVGTSVQIALEGYVHRWSKATGAWKGEGWSQTVLITFTGTLDPAQEHGAAELDSGEIRAGEIEHSHLVPLPLDAAGSVTLRLELRDGDVLDFSGQDLKIAVTGDGSFIEALPDAFKPTTG